MYLQHMITRLGYRFVLTRARFPKSVGRGASFDLTFSWTNKANGRCISIDGFWSGSAAESSKPQFQ